MGVAIPGDQVSPPATVSQLGGADEELRAYRRVLGLRSRTLSGVVKKVLEGLDFAVADRLRRRLDLTQTEFAEAVQISPRTLHRRRQSGRLQPDESDRVLRLCRLLGRATDLFEGNEEQARQWLTRKQRALGSRSPLGVARTDIGTRQVTDLIGRLEHGVFT